MFPFPVDAKCNADDFFITVEIANDCPKSVPRHGDSEEYKLIVKMDGATLSTDSVWGAIRGMDSISQLIFYDEKDAEYKIRTVRIHDFPRFPLRGLLIDSSRHFLSMKVIKRQLDIMAMNKMNVLHWHLVDSEAFPYVSEKFPNLAKTGAYSPKHQYSPSDVQEIIEFARVRGIRVIPEFDLPGHTGAWQGHPELLTECFDCAGKPTYLPNLVDPSKNSTRECITELVEKHLRNSWTKWSRHFPMSFCTSEAMKLRCLLKTAGELYRDYAVELYRKMMRNSNIRKFMKEKSFGSNIRLLENYFFERLHAIVRNLKVKRRTIFWQEVFDNNIPEYDSIIHIWKGRTHQEIIKEVKNVTAKGYNAIVSACW
ncbi:unnamed protein product [Strongylus vulgaris]|uniref:beta-N-acetylhexosaminidase n=1 Tax=Strongylus vulgaris TaxID=40348 RepID=A0A3P7JC99_STRVU|nr:unnamed protein product [Strongylus vulgaris]